MSCHCAIADRPERKQKRGKAWNVVAGTMVLLIPKCAMCWSAYLGLLGWAGVPLLAYRSWFMPVAVLFFSVTLGRLFRRALHSRQFLAFSLAFAAAALICWDKLTGPQSGITVVAMTLMLLSWFADMNLHPPAWRMNFSSNTGSGKSR